MADLATRLQKVRQSVTDAARKAGRDPAEIKLLAVSKTFPQGPIREAFAAGQIRFGENRVQEAEEKVPALEDLPLEWHLIGHLQSNKARRAVELFQVIQSLDSPKIARKVGRIAAELGKSLQVFAQVDIGEEEQKFGVPSDQLPQLVAAIDQEPTLELQGLMCIPPWDPDPEAARPYFKRLAALLEQINRSRSQPLSGLSMGMSNDFPIAIQEGSTLIRVGTAIFGPRK